MPTTNTFLLSCCRFAVECIGVGAVIATAAVVGVLLIVVAFLLCVVAFLLREVAPPTWVIRCIIGARPTGSGLFYNSTPSRKKTKGGERSRSRCVVNQLIIGNSFLKIIVESGWHHHTQLVVSAR